MLDYSVSYYLGEYWSNQPLYAEKIVPLIDHLLSNGYEGKENLSSAFYELINKYQNPQDLPTSNIVEYIKENGYEYILDLLNPSTEELKIIVYLIVLIHMLKGSKKGLQVVLSIFSLNAAPTDIKIIEWFNELPVQEENTFRIESAVDMSVISDNFFENFSVFIKQYVYPELKSFRARYNLVASLGYTVIPQIEINYLSSGDVN